MTNEQKEYSREDFYNKLVYPLKSAVEPVIIGDPDEVWMYCEAYAKQEVEKALKEKVKVLKRKKKFEDDNSNRDFDLGVVEGLRLALSELKNGRR